MCPRLVAIQIGDRSKHRRKPERGPTVLAPIVARWMEPQVRHRIEQTDPAATQIGLGWSAADRTAHREHSSLTKADCLKCKKLHPLFSVCLLRVSARDA